MFTLDVSLVLGPSKAGLTDLRGQLLDTAGANVGTAVSTGFSDIGYGNYLWHYASWPDNHQGGVKFYSNATPTVVLAFTSINPTDYVIPADVSTLPTSVWSYGGGRTITGGTITTVADKVGYTLTTATIQQIWDVLTANLTTVGSIGKWIIDKLDVGVSSRATLTPTDVWAATTRTITGGIITQNNDKTNYGLSPAAIQSFWDYLTTSLTTVGSVGKRIADLLDVPISSRSNHTPSDAAIAVWGAVSRTITGGVVTTVSDKVGYALSSASIQAIWDQLTSTLTTIGSIGKYLLDNLNAPITTRSQPSDIPSAATNASTVWAYSTRTLTAAASITAADVWNYTTRTLTSAGAGGATAAEVWAYASRSLTTGIPTAAEIWGYTPRTITDLDPGALNSIWSYSSRIVTGFSNPAIQSIWDILLSSINAPNSVGLLVKNGLSTPNSALSTSIGLVPQNVWAYTTRTLTAGAGGGSTAQDIWSYVPRTLTMTPVQIQDYFLQDGTITIVKAVTFFATWTDIMPPVDWTKAYFTVKFDLDDSDGGTVQILDSKTGGGNDGLTYLNGKPIQSTPAVTKNDASLIIDEIAHTAEVIISDNATSQLQQSSNLYWDIKFVTSAGVSVLLVAGRCNIELTPTLTI